MTARANQGRSRRALSGALVSAITGALLWDVGGDLPLPRSFTGQALGRWYAASGAVLAVFAVGRVVLIASSAVMAVAFVWLSVALARWSGPGLPSRLLLAGRVPGVAAVLRLAIGLSATGVAVAACGSSPPGTTGTTAGPPPVAPILTNTGPALSMGGADRSPPPASPLAPPVGPFHASRPSPPKRRPAAAPQPRPAPASVPARWVVRPGDSLWSIAEATIGGPPERVAAYWERLVTANRPTLPDPADPSLLFPGDVVALPPRWDSPG